MRITNTSQFNGFVPPYVFENRNGGSAKDHNGGIVPPWVSDKTGGRGNPPAPNGNGGVVGPRPGRPGEVSDKVGGRGNPPKNTGIVPPHLQHRAGIPQPEGACFPELPTQTDPSGIDVIFTDVQLPPKARPLVNLTGECFPQVPCRNDAAAPEVLFEGVQLPGALQMPARRATLAN